jgi:cytosine/creatinine deaminase
MDDHGIFMERAFAQAKKSAGEGGVPVGACLVHNGVVIAEGHNRRKQEETLILHGETDCLRNAGLFPHLSESTLYTTLSPCMMCAGTIVQFRIPRVVIGENRNFGGNEDFLRSRGGRRHGTRRSRDQFLFRWLAGGKPGIMGRRYRSVS